MFQEFEHLFQQVLINFCWHPHQLDRTFEFSATISLFVAPTPVFFATNPEQCPNNCSNSCFLFEKARARGGAFGEPSGFPFVPPRGCLRLGGVPFFGTDFQELLFSKKKNGSQHGSKIGSELTREATSDATFTFFREP